MHKYFYSFIFLSFVSFFLSSCLSFGGVVKVFHIKSGHKIPTYTFSSSAKEVKAGLVNLFNSHPELISKTGQKNDYACGIYFAEINDSVFKKSFMIRFGLDEGEDFAKNSSACTIKIFSIKYSDEPEWIPFYSKKLNRKKMKELDKLVRKEIFTKVSGLK